MVPSGVVPVEGVVCGAAPSGMSPEGGLLGVPLRGAPVSGGRLWGGPWWDDPGKGLWGSPIRRGPHKGRRCLWGGLLWGSPLGEVCGVAPDEMVLGWCLLGDPLRDEPWRRSVGWPPMG